MVGFPLRRKFLLNRRSGQTKVCLVTLNFCRGVLRPAGSFFELGNIWAKHVLHGGLDPGTERPALCNHHRQVHPVGKAGEEIAPGLIPIAHIFLKSHAKPLSSSVDPFCTGPDSLDKGPRISAGVPTYPIQRQSASGRLVGAPFGLMTGDLPP